MAMVEVHNITDRPNTDSRPRAYMIGGTKLRPGKKVLVDSTVVNGTMLRQLHGKCLWFGSLPPRFARTSRSALRARDRQLQSSRDLSPAMTREEARAYLGQMKLSELLELPQQMSPPLSFKKVPSMPALVARVSRALFQSDRELDPETFFWLRRWTKDRHGDFVLRE